MLVGNILVCVDLRAVGENEHATELAFVKIESDPALWSLIRIEMFVYDEFRITMQGGCH